MHGNELFHESPTKSQTMCPAGWKRHQREGALVGFGYGSVCGKQVLEEEHYVGFGFYIL